MNGSTDPFVVASFGDNTQPAVTALPNGNWAVAYTDSGWAFEDVGISLTIMGPAGQIVQPFVQVNAPGSVPNESDPDIAVLDNGFIVVSWTDPANNGDILCRIFTQSGVPVLLDGSSAPINLSSSSGADIKSAISGVLAGEFVTVWQDSDTDGSGTAITARVQELVRTTTGDSTSETLNGDQIRDIMSGGFGDDTLRSFAGDDWLDGGAGVDSLMGGLGNDTYAFVDADDTIVEAAGGGTDTIESFITQILVSEVENLTLTGTDAVDGTGNTLANTMLGNDAVNTLTGLAGNDRLDGRAGADDLFGGTGDDTYVVDDAGDDVNEQPGAGIDTVESAVDNWTLDAEVENLTLVGSATRGFGNELSNTLIGNAFGNLLDGKAGADDMYGSFGNDTYVVDNVNDHVNEGVLWGVDTVQSSITHTLAANVDNLALTGTAAINGTGNDLDNTISGNSAANVLLGGGSDDTINGFGGNDRLDGGFSGDAMAGGLGNDTYVVDHPGDTVVESGSSGTDLVQTTENFTLSANVENLALNGVAPANGTGNALANVISGNPAANLLSGLGANDTLTGFGGNDRLDGGTGADAMSGGAGDDTYVVDNAGDTIAEASGGGTDVVQSTVTVTLSANVEMLALNGAGAINGTGNASANTMFGNSAANRLDGDAGADTITGFGGADVFVFDDGNGADTIGDFQNGADRFDLTAVAGIDDIGDLTIIDNGSTVTVDYGTGNFRITNLADPVALDAGDFLF